MDKGREGVIISFIAALQGDKLFSHHFEGVAGNLHEERGGGGGTHFMDSRSCTAIERRIPTMPRRSTSGFHRPSIVHQAQGGGEGESYREDRKEGSRCAKHPSHKHTSPSKTPRKKPATPPCKPTGRPTCKSAKNKSENRPHTTRKPARLHQKYLKASLQASLQASLELN